MVLHSKIEVGCYNLVLYFKHRYVLAWNLYLLVVLVLNNSLLVNVRKGGTLN